MKFNNDCCSKTFIFVSGLSISWQWARLQDSLKWWFTIFRIIEGLPWWPLVLIIGTSVHLPKMSWTCWTREKRLLIRVPDELPSLKLRASWNLTISCIRDPLKDSKIWLMSAFAKKSQIEPLRLSGSISSKKNTAVSI